MRAIAFSDAHADRRNLGASRFEDVRRGFQEVAYAAVREQAEHVFFCGDLCDPDCGPIGFAIANLACAFAARMANLGKETHWIAGNHDVVEDGSGLTTLSPLRAFQADGANMAKVHVYEAPRWVNLCTGTEDFELLVLPFTASSGAYDPVALFESDPFPFAPAVVLSHLCLPGIHPGSETTEMPRGRTVDLPFEALERWRSERKGPSLVLNGHYHRRQVYRSVQVVGSLDRLAFDEGSNDPGYLVVSI